MISWEYFSKRRNIDLSEFVNKNKMSYKDVHDFCIGRDINPPSEIEYNNVAVFHLLKTKSKAKTKQKVSDIKPKTSQPKPKRKYTRKKSTSSKK